MAKISLVSCLIVTMMTIFFPLKSTKYYKNRPRYPEIQTTKPYNGIGWTEPRAEDVLGIIISLPILYYQNETLIELVC